MDISVTPDPDGTSWHLTDLLGRSVGKVTEGATGKFTVYPANKAIETMAGLPAGPYGSLNEALSKIETLTRGVCRIARA